VKPLIVMNVTTVYGIIGMDYVSHDHGCGEYPVPLPHRHGDPRVHDHERKSQCTASLAYQPCTADNRRGGPPRHSCHGVVLWMVGDGC